MKRYSNKRYPRSGHNNFTPRRGPRAVKVFNPQFILANIPTNGSTPEIKGVFVPQHTFLDFPVLDILKQNIISKKYTAPTPIQDQVIPVVLSERDVIGIANTGTGKTAAFLIPLIDTVSKNPHKKVLIIAPTRELAVQIQNEFVAFARGMNLCSVLCIGGVNISRQKNALRRGYQFVIGTPGRIKDLAKQHVLDLSRFGCVVLDEADTMVDIGFIHDIKYFISLLSPNRQSLFFSATIDGKVREILYGFVKNPVTISVKKQDMAVNIQQDVVRTGPDKTQKLKKLHDLLIQQEFEKVLIFGRTKWGVQKLADELISRGFRAGAIHGNKNQNQRQRAIDAFKKNELQILLATDVASRGLDIPNVSHVINYDLPESYEAYIHRIGRTGRADKKGIALTFV